MHTGNLHRVCTEDLPFLPVDCRNYASNCVGLLHPWLTNAWPGCDGLDLDVEASVLACGVVERWWTLWRVGLEKKRPSGACSWRRSVTLIDPDSPFCFPCYSILQGTLSWCLHACTQQGQRKFSALHASLLWHFITATESKHNDASQLFNRPAKKKKTEISYP